MVLSFLKALISFSHHSLFTGFQIETFWHSAVSRIFLRNFCLLFGYASYSSRFGTSERCYIVFARHDLLIGAHACVLHLIANLRAPNRQRRTKRWFLLLHVVVVVVLPTPLAWNGFRMKVLQIRHIWLYWKVASSNTSCLADFFRLLMKGFFDPYVLWPFVKKFIS